MNCFNHPDKPALGICKACSKGLCKECATDLEHGIACKNKHETEVENINMIISKNSQLYNAAPKDSLIMPLFYIFMGLVFAGYGYSKGSITDLPFVLGVGFIIFGGIIFIKHRMIFGKKTA